jgi:predicted NAD/FAD-dependent oxidoreductase
MTNVSTAYAPEGKVLISVSCNGIIDFEDQELDEAIKKELEPWFGKQVEAWSHLKTYKVKYALPNLTVLKDDLTIADMKINDGLYCCGDHLLNGSINAAMKSGRLLADFIIFEQQKN